MVSLLLLRSFSSRVVAQMHTPGITYTLRGGAYVQLTERSRGITLLESRGPGFAMPATSGFDRFGSHHPTEEPTAAQVISALEATFAAGYDTGPAVSHEGDLKGVTFAGTGDPLFNDDTVEVLCEVASWVRHVRPGSPIAISTLGLVPAFSSPTLIERLKASGVERVSVLLNASNPLEYSTIMKPEDGLTFVDVCSFVANCNEAGLSTVCTAVESPKLKMAPISALAKSLGADFYSRTYHP